MWISLLLRLAYEYFKDDVKIRFFITFAQKLVPLPQVPYKMVILLFSSWTKKRWNIFIDRFLKFLFVQVLSPRRYLYSLLVLELIFYC